MKNNTRKILLAFLVVFTLLMSMATVTAFAEETSTDDVTIYFENNWLWTDVRCYYWGDGVTCAEFPGESMELYGSYDGHEVYSYNVPAGITGLIISGFKDTAPTERDQTPDITTGIVDGVAWRMQWDGGNWVESFDYDPSNPNQGGSTGGSTGEGTTYTVAGFAGLCYSDWNPADNYNDMTLNPETGLYEKTFTGIPADYYECKVAANHSWTQSWGGSSGDYGNYSFTTFEEHDITITFDPATGTVGHILSDSTGAAEDRPQPEKPDIDYEDTIIVYLSNSANWETPFVYFWTSGSSDQNASWPGQEMEWDGEKMLFYVEVPKYYKNIIFSNSGNPQTADLSIPQQGGQYYDNGTGSWDDLKNFVPPVPPEDTTEDVTVYVKDDAGWGQVYIHFWSTTGIEATTFPGSPMEKDENGYWVFTIPAENYGVLFTNGVNWDQPGAAQTCDLLIPTNGKVYISNANSCLYDDGIGNDNDAWYSVGGNSGNTDNDNGNTGNNGGNGGNTGDNTPDVPSNDKPATEMTFLQKLALKLLLFLRSIEEMFAGFFKK